MQIAIHLKTSRASDYGAPLYVQRIKGRARPMIETSAEPVEADPSATVDALDVILGEIMATTNRFAGYRIEARDFVHICEG